MQTLILGGARSGKSRLAQRMAADAMRVAYVATYRSANDPEMTERVERHRASRPASWQTIEEALALADAVERASLDVEIVIVDCVTVWLSNLLWEHRSAPASAVEEIVTAELNRIATAASRGHVIIVSNEVGSGVVPEHPVARVFRDIQGFANQWAADAADQVILAVAGLPLYLKRPSREEHRS